MTMSKRDNQKIKEAEVKSSDGRSVFACYRKPEGEDPFPAVVFIHGGYGDNKEYTQTILEWSVAELLLQENLVVFSTDYRVDHSGKDVFDIVSAFKFVAGLPFVDGNRIAYFGDSHGAYLAIMAATLTDPFALIHGWGVADMAVWYEHIKKIPASYYKKVTEDLAHSLGGLPDQVPEAYKQVSPITHVANIKCPILIMHGEDDEEVPAIHAHILARAIEQAGGQCELMMFKGAAHGLRSPDARRKMDPTVLKFLKKHLKK
jgi:dipeptidyl aminopeptidase/acylaminoacyl peptidase